MEQLYLRSGDYAQLVTLLLRKAEIVADPAEKKELYFKAAQLNEEVLENLDRAIDVYRQVLSVDDVGSGGAGQLERLVHPPRSGGTTLKDVYAKKAELATTPDEKKQMLFVLGQVYDRELGSGRARSRPIGRSWISIPRTTTLPGARSAVSAAGRWYDLLRSWSAQTELAPSPAEMVRCGTASASCGESS